MLNKIKAFFSSAYVKASTLCLGLMAPNLVFADTKVDLMGAQLTESGLSIPGANAAADPKAGTVAAFNNIYGVAKTFVQGITGLLSIVMVGVFVYKAFQLSRCGDNPTERSKIIQGMVFFFIGAAAFGAASFLTGLFYNMLR